MPLRTVPFGPCAPGWMGAPPCGCIIAPPDWPYPIMAPCGPIGDGPPIGADPPQSCAGGAPQSCWACCGGAPKSPPGGGNPGAPPCGAPIGAGGGPYGGCCG